MATSGSTDFSMTANDVIVFALKKLRVLSTGETPDAEQGEDAMQALTLMLKGWQKYESLWRYTEGSATLLANTANYTLSPMPHRVISARYYNGTSDTPMTLLTREEYYDLPLKTSTGVPSQYYVDYQRDSTVLYVWQPLASVTSQTIKYTYQRKFEDVDELTNDLDIRQEHLELVGYNLASRLADDYGRGGEITARVIERAGSLLNDFLDDDREDEIRFVPAYGGWR